MTLRSTAVSEHVGDYTKSASFSARDSYWKWSIIKIIWLSVEAAWGQSFFNHFCQRKSLWQLNIVSFRDNIVAYLIYLTANIFCLLFCILYRLLVLMSLQKQNLNHWAYYQLFIVTLHLFFLFYWNTDHSVYTCQLFGAFEEAISAKGLKKHTDLVLSLFPSWLPCIFYV